MPLNREEIAADLVWRYVEHLRQSEGSGVGAALSAAELAQLVDTLAVAGDLTLALAPEEIAAARKEAVLRRVEAVLADPPVTPSRAPVTARPWLAVLSAGSPVPVWKFRAAFGAALVFAAAFGMMGMRTPKETVVKQVRVPVRAAEIDIQPVQESLVHDLLPRMVRNELPPKQERNLMWHMLVCRGCFDEYVELKHQTAARDPQATLASFRW